MRFSFLMLGAVLFLLRDPGLIWGFSGICAAHELGHILAARLTGGRISSVELRGTGVLMTVSRDHLAGTAAELFVLLSGPAVNLLTALGMYIAGERGSLLRLSLWTGAANLLPFSGLDGGSALELLVSGRPDERRLLRWISVLRAAAAAGIVLAAAIVYSRSARL